MVDELRSRVPDTVPDDVELFEQDGDVYGRDSHGEFALDPMAGSCEPPEDTRCGVPLRHWEARYGQKRFCTMLKVGNFPDHNYEHDDYCRQHQSRYALMKRAHELFEHGYFATNYVNFAEKLSADKFIFAVEMFRGLIEQSTHDFDVQKEVRTIDTSASSIISEDQVAVELWIPADEKYALQANELWTAALKEVQVQNMQEVVFEDNMEKRTLTASSDMEGQITDTHYESTEHHLHLPISRLAGDIKDHLANGGVATDDDESGVIKFQKNDYTMDVGPDESDSDDAESVSEVSEEFTTKLAEADEDEAAEVEIE